MKILVTGGAGYIGSHTIIELFEKGFDHLISVDNYINSNACNYDKIEKITGKKVKHFKIDMSNFEMLSSFFKEHAFDAVIHFASLKSVPESVEQPLEYYRNNIGALINLLNCMKMNEVNKLIFSSSCSIYGNPENLPVDENTPFGNAESPYARTKQMGEHIIHDFCKANANFNAISLRYFNPVGAHESALIGEGFSKKPNNLVPIITQTAAGIREKMMVYGNDYETKDGSCIRDYIHVSDIAEAHVKAINLFESNQKNYEVINLGSGNGTTVLEIVKSFEKVSNKKLNYQIGERRAGDVAAIYADNSKAKKVLDWIPKYSIDQMLLSAWQWQQNMEI